jgi:transposase
LCYTVRMKKRDARKLSSDAQYEVRRTAIKLLKSGKSQKEVADILDVARQAIWRWQKLYDAKGLSGLKLKHRGRCKGDFRILTPEQEKEIQRMIRDKNPEQLKLNFALWNRQAVMDLIKQKFKIKLPIRTAGEYLKRWGYTPQKPIRKAYEQQPEKVQQWLDETYPEIEKRAKDEKAQIQWADETGLKNTDARGRGYAPKGKTPTVSISAKRFSVNMISSLSNKGQLRFMIYQGSFNADTFLTFLRRLIKDSKQKIFLIVDNLRVHHAKKVQAWTAKHRKDIELFFLPPYSPEHNPDEYVNQDIKQELKKKPSPDSQAQLHDSLSSYMRSLQRKPKKVKKFFEHEKVLYAKAS